MSKESKSAGSATTLGLLGVAFVVLKLTNVIDWSWWWVTLPFWGGLALVLAILLGVFLWTLAADLFSKHTR
jgi:phosphoglycerol transferase MdoB-like AlkP superfamily enzyme